MNKSEYYTLGGGEKKQLKQRSRGVESWNISRLEFHLGPLISKLNEREMGWGYLMKILLFYYFIVVSCFHIPVYPNTN